MARQEQANDIFALTSFLYGGNAHYIEELQAQYENDPASVGPEWQEFFNTLDDNKDDVIKNAKGASWEKANWPIAGNGELVSALDGNWGEVEKHITDKLKAKANGAAAPGNGVAAAISPVSDHESCTPRAIQSAPS